jgi:hypothetical protein
MNHAIGDSGIRWSWASSPFSQPLGAVYFVRVALETGRAESRSLQWAANMPSAGIALSSPLHIRAPRALIREGTHMTNLKLPRRDFLHLAAGAAALFVTPQIAAAQTVPVMGYVAAKNANPERLAIFKKGLTDLGYVEGKNIRIEYRDAVLDAEYHGVMADMVNRKVDVILAANVAAAVAAAKATTTIPVVMLAVNDPVGVGVVKSLKCPGTNVTGTTTTRPN